MVDIVTHAGIGLVLAAPFLGERPELGIGLALGSVLPDLDACSRIAGKRAFLAAHQTWSHAVPVIALLSLGIGIAGQILGVPGIGLGGGLAAGMLLHALLDLTNTYGIALWLPLSRRRWCLEWMFFIDLGTIALTVLALAWIAIPLLHGRTPGWIPTAAWGGALLPWLAGRAWLRMRAAHLAPAGTLAIIPSAWLPWRMYGTARAGDAVLIYTLDALTGAISQGTTVPIHDHEVADILRRIPEVQAMRALTPCYHAVRLARSGGTAEIGCRDLRIRNFTSRFGACDILVVDGDPRKVELHA